MSNDLRLAIGKRVQIPVHYGAWMRGLRYGVITQYRANKPGVSAFVYVKPDKLPTARIKLWQHDWDYATLLDDRSELSAINASE